MRGLGVEEWQTCKVRCKVSLPQCSQLRLKSNQSNQSPSAGQTSRRRQKAEHREAVAPWKNTEMKKKDTEAVRRLRERTLGQ